MRSLRNFSIKTSNPNKTKHDALKSHLTEIKRESKPTEAQSASQVTMAFINAVISDSSAPYREVRAVQFGILSPDEIVTISARPLLPSF